MLFQIMTGYPGISPGFGFYGLVTIIQIFAISAATTPGICGGRSRSRQAREVNFGYVAQNQPMPGGRLSWGYRFKRIRQAPKSIQFCFIAL
jgi:hypothetical protein